MILEKFGQRVKSLRETMGVSQSRLSNLTGIMREQISKIENGQTNPTLETIYKFTVAFKIPLSKLMEMPIEYTFDLKSYKVKPFVKWAGGKTQLLDEIIKLVPQDINTYFEPFLGGGAVFFNVTPRNAIISDFNRDLVDSYRCFKSKKNFKLMVEQIIKHQINHSEDYYYQVREMDRETNYDEQPIFVRAARTIYLNKSCFNGLYRVNSKGFFNVPSGKYKAVSAYEKDLFNEIHEYFMNNSIRILNQDFERVVKEAKAGDFVYFDPPYDTFEEKNNFTTYTKNAFGKGEQVRLSNVFKNLNHRGVKVMLSNHNTEFIRSLYEGFNIRIVNAKRSINSKAAGRGNVEEVIITNY